MKASHRWRLAIPLTVLSGLCLAATLLGARAFWSVDSSAENALTAFLILMFAMMVGMAVSIGFDRNIQDMPWLRLGTIALFFVLASGVALVRRSL
ncbi:hypothetical protein ACWKSP_29500 [Micromonosporaceae bacterium Da 78-11]